MAFTISVDGPILVVTFLDEIVPADLVRLGSTLDMYENGPVVPNRLAGMHGGTSIDIRVTDVISHAHFRKAQVFKNAFKSALVANTDVQFGLARMFQTLNDHPQINIQIFRDECLARAWLEEPD